MLHQIRLRFNDGEIEIEQTDTDMTIYMHNYGEEWYCALTLSPDERRELVRVLQKLEDNAELEGER